jgi:hypothetical protein
MRKSTTAIACCLFAAFLAVVDIAPFVLLLPVRRTDGYTGGGLPLLAVSGGGAGFVASKLEACARRTLFTALVIAAIANILAAVSLRTLPPAFLNQPVSGRLASLLSLDGEYAGIADGYELWCAIWAALAGAASLFAWSVTCGARAARH